MRQASPKAKEYLHNLRKSHPTCAADVHDDSSAASVSDAIDQIKANAHPFTRPFPPGSKAGILAEILRRNGGNLGNALSVAHSALPPRDLPLTEWSHSKLRSYRLCFERNVGGAREPLSPPDQHRKLQGEIERIYKALIEHGEKWGELPKPQDAPKPAPAPEPQEKGFRGIANKFRTRLNELRDFDRKRGGVYAMDSQRCLIEGLKLLAQGIPMEGVLYSLTAAWAPEARSQAAVSDFDYTAWGRSNGSPTDAHGVSEYVARAVKANVPVLLTGPAGTGKSTAAKYAAKQAGLDYYEVNLAGAMASAIKGKDRLKEFIESQFTVAYSQGGLLCIEEIDASHPTVLTAINNAIAGDQFWNDADGKVYDRHPDFRIVATANTLGTGATKEHNARNKLDGATIDRFRPGTILVPRDATLEDNIFETMVAALA